MLHNSCNIGTRALPDMYALALGRWRALGHRAYISGNALVPMLQLLNVTLSHLRSKEITGIHKPCIPHSNDSSATTEYKVCIQM